MIKQDIKGLSKKELTSLLEEMGEPSYRAVQVFRWLHKKAARDFGRMANLPGALCSRLSERFYVSWPRLMDMRRSPLDGTTKYLLALEDASAIETVYLPERKRATSCVSTQVGCRYACKFCASGARGYTRDLKASEIIDQALFVRAGQRIPPTNVVFMGIGEPLDNYDNVMKAARILNDADGVNIGARRMTISTCGLVPGIERLSEEGIQVELSVSLHSANDAVRSELVPVNRKYPIKELMICCRDYIKKTKRVITFEYVLIKGLNAKDSDASELAALLKGMDCKVNLIACNRAVARELAAPGEREARAFARELKKRGVKATLRRARGYDIDAGCGQLRMSRV